MAVTLFGFRYSVYVRAVRIALDLRGVAYHLDEVNPFAPPDPKHPNPHPMNRIPVLDHDGFVLFETAAILRYVDAAFDGPSLVPRDARATARMAQVQAIVDAYAYWPLVRQVYANAVFDPANGDKAALAQGLTDAAAPLAMLDRIAEEALVLDGHNRTLADCHLAPMIAAFSASRQGAQMLAQYPALAATGHGPKHGNP